MVVVSKPSADSEPEWDSSDEEDGELYPLLRPFFLRLLMIHPPTPTPSESVYTLPSSVREYEKLTDFLERGEFVHSHLSHAQWYAPSCYLSGRLRARARCLHAHSGTP